MRSIIKHTAIILAFFFICNITLPAGEAAYTNLRPLATARHDTVVSARMASIGLLHKASSSGERILYGNARVNRAVTGYAVFAWHDGNTTMLTFPVWGEDLVHEQTRFQEMISELRTNLKSVREQDVTVKRDQNTQFLYNEAKRILDKHVSQITRYMDTASTATLPDSDQPVLDKNPEILFMDLLEHDLATYKELKQDMAYKATMLLQQILSAGSASGDALVEYGDPHNPTEQELAALSERAAHEYKRFVRIMNHETANIQTQIDAQDQTIEVSLRKIIAALDINTSKHIPQLKQLINAVVALYAAADGVEKAQQAQQAQIVLAQVLQDLQKLSEHPLLKLTPAQAVNMPEGKSKAMVGDFADQISAAQAMFASAWDQFLAITAPALSGYTEPALLGIIKRIQSNMHMAHDAAGGIDNAVKAKVTMGAFQMILMDHDHAFTENDLKEANVPAHSMILKGANYVFIKNKLSGENSDPAMAHILDSFRDAAGAIEHISRLLKEDSAKERKSQVSSRPLILCLPTMIDPSIFNKFAKTHNIVAVVTTAGTTTEHLPLVATGLGIPYVRVTSANANLRELITDGQKLIVHASAQQGKSRVILRPSIEDTQKAEIDKRRQDMIAAYQRQHATGPVRTGFYFESAYPSSLSVNVLANGASTSEIYDARSIAAGGIGLFRSEFLPSIDSNANTQYVHEFHSLEQPGMPAHDITDRLHRALLFYDMRAEMLEILQAADPDKPFLFRLWDFKKQEKGAGFLNLLPEDQQGENFEDNQSPVRQDILTLQIESLIDALFILRARGITLQVTPMFPEVNHPDQIRWFFHKVLPTAVEYYKIRLGHEMKIDSLNATEHGRTIDAIVADMRFAVMAERLGIDGNILDILEEFPINAVSVGTNDFTEDLLADFFKGYGVPVSRRDPHFEERFFMLEPLVLRKIIVLAENIVEHNKRHPDRKVRLGICGDMATRPEFTLFVLWLKGRYGDALDLYISVSAGQVLGQKDFIRLVDPAVDLYIDGNPALGGIFDTLLLENHTHDLAVESLAVNRVQAVLKRGENRTDYIDAVLDPLAVYTEHVLSAAPQTTPDKTPFAGALAIMPRPLSKAIASSA